jgi:hypothetical protein
MHQHIYRNINYEKRIIELVSIIMGLNTSDIYKEWTNNSKVWDNILEKLQSHSEQVEQSEPHR